MTPGGSDPTPVKRRLAAILAADAVGYSARMAEDEERTLRTLAGHRSVIGGLIAAHDGRIVGTAGDSVLAEFPSSVAAVRCAVEIQEALATRNDSLPAPERLQFRIGVNLGDVIVEGNDILGDGVNVAARLESIAEPGGVCIASSVFDQISGKLNLGFDDMGEQSLKNITRPVRAYRVGSAASVQRPAPAAKTQRSPWMVVGALVVVAVIGVVLYNLSSQRRDDNPAPTAAVSPLADEATRLKLQIAEAERAKAEAELARVRAENEKPRASSTAPNPPRAGGNLPAPAPAATLATPSSPGVQPSSDAQTGGAPGARASGRAGFGRGFADARCEAEGDEPAAAMRIPVTVNAQQLTLNLGTPGRPGFTNLHGTLAQDGTLILDGTFIGPRGRIGRGTAHYEGRLVNGRGRLTGHHDRRVCTLDRVLR